MSRKNRAKPREFLPRDMTKKRSGGTISDWDDDLKLFQNARSQKALGEASVCSLWSKTAAVNIRGRGCVDGLRPQLIIAGVLTLFLYDVRHVASDHYSKRVPVEEIVRYESEEQAINGDAQDCPVD